MFVLSRFWSDMTIAFAIDLSQPHDLYVLAPNLSRHCSTFQNLSSTHSVRSGPLIRLSLQSGHWLKKSKAFIALKKKNTPREKPILNYSSLDPFAGSAGMHPAEGRCLGFPSESGNASLFHGGIRARGSRRTIVSLCCSGPNLLVESARHRLRSQQTVRVERQLWLWLIRLNHLPSDWWRWVWEWSHHQLYLACWL